MMKTSCRLAVLLLLGCAVPLAAQGVFVITDVRADGVVVSPVDSGTRKLSDITAGFTRFDIFDIYSSRNDDSFLADFVDSLYYDSTTSEGVLLRYVWKGENKFVTRGFFAVRTGRVYVTGQDETVSTATAAAAPSGGITGTFGASGLSIMAGIGGGVLQYFASAGSGAVTVTADVQARVWYRFIGASLRADLPVSPSIQAEGLTGGIFLDLGYDILPFWTVYSSVGWSIGEESGLTLAAGTFVLLPLFGAGTPLMPFIDISTVVPSVITSLASRAYVIVSIGLKL